MKVKVKIEIVLVSDFRFVFAGWPRPVNWARGVTAVKAEVGVVTQFFSSWLWFFVTQFFLIVFNLDWYSGSDTDLEQICSNCENYIFYFWNWCQTKGRTSGTHLWNRPETIADGSSEFGSVGQSVNSKVGVACRLKNEATHCHSHRTPKAHEIPDNSQSDL